jgi:hypothetical protein
MPGMELTAHRESEDGPLVATGLVVACYLSAALMLMQNYF